MIREDLGQHKIISSLAVIFALPTKYSGTYQFQIKIAIKGPKNMVSHKTYQQTFIFLSEDS